MRVRFEGYEIDIEPMATDEPDGIYVTVTDDEGQVFEGFLARHTKVVAKEVNQKLWNIAADYAINPIIEACGVELPKDALKDARFEGMTTDQIYRILKAKIGEGAAKEFLSYKELMDKLNEIE